MSFSKLMLVINWLIYFLGHIQKKCGVLDPKELALSIGARLPIRTNEDDRYFNDSFQALPKEGYTKMVSKMINHENIKINLETNFKKGMEVNFDHSFLCIPIDKFYDYKFGSIAL